MKAENITTTGFNNAPRPLADGLYECESGYRFWIEHGVLFMPAAVLALTVFYTNPPPFRLVKNERDKLELFVRAAAVAERKPEFAQDLQAIATKYHVSL
mgnify:CR=1 FL=1